MVSVVDDVRLPTRNIYTSGKTAPFNFCSNLVNLITEIIIGTYILQRIGTVGY